MIYLIGVPSNMRSVKHGAYPTVLRNMMISVILLNGPLMLLVLAVVPYDKLLDGGNVLSIMASIVSHCYHDTTDEIFDTSSVLEDGFVYG